MWFRMTLLALPLAGCLLLCWLATHISSEPVILGRYSPSYFRLLTLLGVAAALFCGLQLPAVFRRLYSVRLQLLLCASSTMIVLLGVELGIRLLDPLGVSYFQESSRYHLDKIPDPELVYRHSPGLHKTYQGVDVAINEMGLRDRPLDEKAESELRLLLLGDSVTFGWGVPIEETYGRKLESLVGARTGRPTTAVNAGVGSYNTVQQAAFLEQYGDLIRPDIVTLLFVDNDVIPNRPPFDPWTKRSLAGKSPPEAITLISRKLWLVRLGIFASRFAGRSSTPPRQESSAEPAGSRSQPPGVTESMAALQRIAAWCSQRQTPFVTFIYRPGNAPPDSMQVLIQEINRVGQTNSFPVCDIWPWWEPYDMFEVTNSIVDSHPNAAGHAVIAAGMARFLEEIAMFPLTQ